jgi:hypothetical protein
LLIEPDLTRTTSSTVSSFDHPISAEIDVSAPGLTITASYGDDRMTVVDALTAAGLPPPADVSVAPAALVRNIEPVEVVRGTNQVTGLGFDTCTAPSAKQMDSWAASPFSTIGIYIGGSERACAQPSLTGAWIVARARTGWHFMPLYVGWQAAWDKLTATASTPAPAVLGKESADDAVTQARGLGIGPGALLYYDMESYTTRAQSVAAMAFLSVWTAELHSRGYRSAVYSSAATGIADLVANRGKIVEPDVVAIAHWNGIADADLNATPSDAWPAQRAHQYLGNVNASYGGVKLNIDKDYLSINNVTPIIGTPSTPATKSAAPTPTPTAISTSTAPQMSTASPTATPTAIPTVTAIPTSTPSASATAPSASNVPSVVLPPLTTHGANIVNASCPIASVSGVPEPGGRASNRLIAC